MKHATYHKTNQWLKKIGINPSDLITSSLLLLQAERAAKWLTQHSLLYSSNDALLIRAFIEQTLKTKSRKKITVSQAYKILNLGTKARRKLYKIKRTGK
jgi:hypothetical protein